MFVYYFRKREAETEGEAKPDPALLYYGHYPYYTHPYTYTYPTYTYAAPTYTYAAYAPYR